MSPSRKAPHVKARWIAMHILRSTGLSTPAVGRQMGGFDHTSVMHALRATKDQRWHDALARATELFCGRMTMAIGTIVYDRPIGPPRAPAPPKTRHAIKVAAKPTPSPDERFAKQLSGAAFESVNVKPSYTYTPTLGPEAREIS